MKKLLALIAFSVLLLSLVLVAGLGTPVLAADENNVIFNGGTADFNTGAVIDDPAIIKAEDFVLSQSTDLTDVHLDVFQRDISLTAEFSYAIWTDKAGVPDSIIQSGVGVNEHKVLIAGKGPNDLRYWFDLDNPLPLTAGTTYWITLFVGNSANPGDTLWYSTTPGFGNTAVTSIDGGINWIRFPSFPVQNNLVLTGPTMVGGELIPLDTTMVLVAGTQTTAAWMIPVIVSAIGIGIVIARKF